MFSYHIDGGWPAVLISSGGDKRNYEMFDNEVIIYIFTGIVNGGAIITIFFGFCGWSFFYRFWESTSMRDELWILVWISLIGWFHVHQSVNLRKLRTSGGEENE